MVLEYMKGGEAVTHPCAPLQKIEFFIRSPCPSPEPVQYKLFGLVSLMLLTIRPSIVALIMKPSIPLRAYVSLLSACTPYCGVSLRWNSELNDKKKNHIKLS